MNFDGAKRPEIRIGFWTATVLTVLFAIFALGFIFTMIKIPDAVIWESVESYAKNADHPVMFLLMMVPFIIAPVFLIMNGCLYRTAVEAKKTVGLLALLFTGVYTAQITFNYYIQLTVVAKNLEVGNLSGLSLWAFFNPLSIGMHLELLGYGMLSVGLIFLSFVFRERKRNRLIFWIFFINGVLNALYIFEPFFMLGGPPIVLSLFILSMPIGTVKVAQWFRQKMPES